ncbi:response regulator [Paenibacillus thalictri]|uniref:Response regulator n=1 Tax=Paenibacillus thalictri TaxID=2527873 RepID=A0A4Q9DYM5_9BACL|nr:response regulator [Paenibacillus thalictri]TBL80988.1 response regulator [Paenibacillus thalictri]
MLRMMIVDDEELPAMRLKRLLTELSEWSVIETFFDPLDAYDYAKANPVDVAFLDISMPDLNGMKLSSLLVDIHPNIEFIFVTGFDEYAVRAFEIDALDYVMKPVTVERLTTTMGKIRRVHRPVVASSSMEVFLFGGMRIHYQAAGGGKESIKLRSPKTEELFAFLVCNKTVSREEIIDTLWSGLPPEKAWKNLNSTVYYIRKAIEASKCRCEITTTGNEIRLDADGFYCDLYEFERLLKEIRHESERNLDLLERAAALYTGSLLQGKSCEWAIPYIRHLEKQYIELLELLAQHYRQSHQQIQALHYYSEIVKLDGTREDIHVEMIQVFMELGRKHEAVRQYEQLEEMLRELDVRPDPKIKELLQ